MLSHGKPENSMTDVFDSTKRSEVMSRIRGRGNASTEMAMVAVFHQARIIGWRRHVELRLWPATADKNIAVKTKSGRIRVRPDFIFRDVRLAIFVDGCFWHGCALHSTWPKRNAEFWESKLKGNMRRDAWHTHALEAAGWSVLRVWEHELCDGSALVRRIEGALGKNKR